MDLSCFNWIQIIKKSDLPANAKLIAFYLSTFMNAEQDIAWPAQSRISHETGLTTPTVRKYLKYLEENDWLIIRKKARHIPTGQQNYLHNEYLITIPQGVISLLSDKSRGKTGDDQGVNSSLPEGKELTPNNNRNNNRSNNIIGYLNKKAGRSFKPVEANLKLIRARLSEGHSEDDLKAVVDRKVAQWKDDPKMSQYLRPATLFNAEKFNQYVGEIGTPLPIIEKPKHKKTADDYRRDLLGDPDEKAGVTIDG